MTIPFEFFSDRLSRIEMYHDFLKDIKFHNYKSSFELHVFGIVNHYQRIQKVVKQTMSLKRKSLTSTHYNSSQKCPIKNCLGYFFYLQRNNFSKYLF
jgi:hypothetical protein